VKRLQGSADGGFDAGFALRGGEGAEGGLILEAGPENFQGFVEDVSGFARVQAEAARGDFTGVEAEGSVGAEAAGGLQFEDAGAALDLVRRKGRKGIGVREFIEEDAFRLEFWGEQVVGGGEDGVKFLGEGGEAEGAGLIGLGGQEVEGAGAGGQVLKASAGAGVGLRVVGAGHAEGGLEVAREERVKAFGGGEAGVRGVEEEGVIEGDGLGLVEGEDLDGGTGVERGQGCGLRFAVEMLKEGGERDAAVGGAEGGEEVEE
jgi:hypothetical protein